MDPAPNAPPSPATPEFKDRRTGLILFGIIEILFAVGCLLMVLLMFFGQMMSVHSGREAIPVRQIILPLVMYGGLGIFLICLGIGSINARRWARAMTLLLSWGWLIMGAFFIALVPIVVLQVGHFPQAQAQTGGQGHAQPLSQETMRTIMVATFLIMGVIQMAISAAFILFYRSRHVKATCEARNPGPSWTDRCPLPVLAMSAMMAWTAFLVLLMPVFSNGVVPFFGVLLSGWSGSILMIACSVPCAYVAWALYRLQPAGWWSAIVLYCLWMISYGITLSRFDMIEIYRRMGYTPRQLDDINKFQFIHGASPLFWLAAVCFIPPVAYLLFLKRYFRRTN